MTSSEHTVLDAIIPGLREEGYEVLVHPSSQMLPHFMDSHAPDAIAVRPDRRLAIEVVKDDAASRARLERFRDLLSRQKDWELRVYWMNSFPVEPRIEASDLGTIEASICQVETLLDQGYGASALLQAWAHFEAAARALAPTRFSNPQAPARLIEALASDGIVTPREADELREISKVRNQVAHGDLHTKIAFDQVRSLNTITRAMISEAAPLT